jgi:hypothetical protein
MGAAHTQSLIFPPTPLQFNKRAFIRAHKSTGGSEMAWQALIENLLFDRRALSLREAVMPIAKFN